MRKSNQLPLLKGVRQLLVQMGVVPPPRSLAKMRKSNRLHLLKEVHLIDVPGVEGAVPLPRSQPQSREVGSIKDLRSEKGSTGGNGLSVVF